MTYEYAAQQPELQPEQVFTEFVFKLASRCNMQPPEQQAAQTRQLPLAATHPIIGCDQCYEYVGTDEWKKQPPFMEPPVIKQGAKRIAEHADAHDIGDIRIVAHGGEVLMASDAYLNNFAETIRNTIGASGRNVHLGIQSNGLLLTPSKLDILKKHDFTVGLSLDGNREANDRHRRDRRGKSTYDRVVRAAGMLANSGVKWGLLTVIDTANNPEETLEAAAALKPDSISIFPPHANWSSPPRFDQHAITLGEWQTRVFERYRTWGQHHPDQPEPPFTMPLVDGYLDALMGAPPLHERISNRYPHELFILPNGDFQRLDTLKSTERGAYKMPYNVFEHSLDTIAHEDPGFIARRMGTAALAEECQKCPLVNACGGDYYPLRFKQLSRPLGEKSTIQDFQDAFKNRSVYCADQKEYIGHLALFVAQQKELLARTPVNASKVWQNMYEEKWWNQNESFNNPRNVPREEQTPADVDAVLAQLNMSQSRFSVFPDSFERPNTPHISFEIWDTISDTMSAEKLTGRLALRVVQALSVQGGSMQEAYFQPAFTRTSSRGYFHTIENLTNNLDHAIIQALFSPKHAFLQDIPFTLRRSGLYWIVTKNAVETHARFAHIPANSFVTVVPLSKGQSMELQSGRVSPETELEIASSPSPARSIRVGFVDAPGDLLVVSHAKSGFTYQADALEEVAHRLPLFDSPEILSVVLEQEGSDVALQPLSGKWPIATAMRIEQLKRSY